jgi:GST-like protein
LIERTAPAAAYLGLSARPPAGDAAMLAKISSADLRARWQAAASGSSAEDRLADSKLKIVQAVNKIEAQLEDREWLMGEFSIADLESYGWLAGMVDLIPSAFAERPRIAEWMQRVRARPAVAKALSLAREPAPAACWAPGPEINRWG